MKPTGSLTIKEIQMELGCSPNHARKLVLTEMRHTDISTGGKPAYRVSRKDFENWKSRKTRDPLARIEEFARKYTR